MEQYSESLMMIMESCRCVTFLVTSVMGTTRKFISVGIVVRTGELDDIDLDDEEARNYFPNMATRTDPETLGLCPLWLAH